MNNQAPGLQKELFSPRGSLICVLFEALSCALSPQGLPRFLRETPRHSSQGGMATTRFPFLRTGGDTSSWMGKDTWRKGGREEPGCSSLSEGAAKGAAHLRRREDIWKDARQVPAQRSASVLLLVAQVELTQLPFPNPP